MEILTVCFLVVVIIALAARELDRVDFTIDDDEDELNELHCIDRYDIAFKIEQEFSENKK